MGYSLGLLPKKSQKFEILTNFSSRGLPQTYEFKSRKLRFTVKFIAFFELCSRNNHNLSPLSLFELFEPVNLVYKSSKSIEKWPRYEILMNFWLELNIWRNPPAIARIRYQQKMKLFDLFWHFRTLLWCFGMKICHVMSKWWKSRN